jgi:hypothetical protein
MGDINALVVFYSRYGTTEKLALAAGLGAIQADANIRLRRVADHADAASIAADANWKKNLDRMNRDYVAPRPADPVWADVIILATPAESSEEVESYVASLSSIGSMTGKLAAPLAPGNNASALKPVYSAASSSSTDICARQCSGPGDKACFSHSRSTMPTGFEGTAHQPPIAEPERRP